jgi:hypothetical protein
MATQIKVGSVITFTKLGATVSKPVIRINKDGRPVVQWDGLAVIINHNEIQSVKN